MIDDVELVGMSVDDARKLLSEHKAPFRISSNNGESFVKSMDWVADRRNLDIVDGKIVSISRG